MVASHEPGREGLHLWIRSQCAYKIFFFFFMLDLVIPTETKNLKDLKSKFKNPKRKVVANRGQV